MNTLQNLNPDLTSILQQIRKEAERKAMTPILNRRATNCNLHGEDVQYSNRCSVSRIEEQLFERAVEKNRVRLLSADLETHQMSFEDCLILEVVLAGQEAVDAATLKLKALLQ